MCLSESVKANCFGINGRPERPTERKLPLQNVDSVILLVFYCSSKLTFVCACPQGWQGVKSCGDCTSYAVIGLTYAVPTKTTYYSEMEMTICA